MKNYNICVLGLGYVGETLFLKISKKFKGTIGFDINKNKINLLKKKYKKKLNITYNYQDIKKANVYIICVPTPLDENKNPDTSFIKKAIEIISINIKIGDLIILESTCYPGCTKELIVSYIEKFKKLEFSKEFYVSFSPERINPGKNQNKVFNITKVIGSPCSKSLSISKIIYKKIFKKIYLLENFEEAELSKLVENTFRQINISFINELTMMCEKLNINIWNTINAASTKNFGFMKFLPSAGTGGHCIPVDPTYLLWKAKSKNFFSKFIELSNQINSEMPRYVISRISNFLNKNSKSFKNTKIFLIGLAYKKDVDDSRESSSVEVFKELVSMGSKVQFHDNFIKKIKINDVEYKSLSLTENNIKHHDIIVILTDHSYINWKIIYKKSKLIFDTRNVFDKYDKNKKIQLL